ncbi:pupal cuticle protein C1B-like [Agrilus planipennis]|uniref:Pupal cuticle protein C1B-like n=1 Tax=Agrilus planipennis TaxID=224129 RepID=A0A7F5RB96_AGRPL|nr:pupal cuticle protein C1B-like [Agrilus planipennis]
MKSMIIFAAVLAFAFAIPSPKADPKPSGVAAYSVPAVPYVYAASAPAVSYSAPVSYAVPVSYSSYSAPVVSYSSYPYSYGYAGDHYVW